MAGSHKLTGLDTHKDGVAYHHAGLKTSPRCVQGVAGTLVLCSKMSKKKLYKETHHKNIRNEV